MVAIDEKYIPRKADNSGPQNPTLAWQGKQGYQFEQPLGAAGLQYVRQRWYDPAMGQFISPEPLGLPDATVPWGIESGQVSGGDVNLFRYAGNNPVNRNDPSGMVGNALAEYLFYKHAAEQLWHQIYTRELSKNSHVGYTGLLYGIWRAAIWKEESDYNRLYNRFGGGPWEVLNKVKEELEKVEKAVHVKKVLPLAKEITEDVEKELKVVHTLISTLQAGHGLSSSNSLAQLKGLGDALTAMGNIVPEELGFGSIIKVYGKYLSKSAVAISHTYAALGTTVAYQYWIEGLPSSPEGHRPGISFPYNDSPTVPFTPAWAWHLAQEHNYRFGNPYNAWFKKGLKELSKQSRLLIQEQK